MSFFTYQACYWAWLKLEKEEVQRGKEGMFLILSLSLSSSLCICVFAGERGKWANLIGWVRGCVEEVKGLMAEVERLKAAAVGKK